jgi:hypothetical protein
MYNTFNSPHGRYHFLRFPFGLICAQDIFQKKVDEAFGDLPGVTGIADDIVISGKTRDEHDKNLKAVMELAQETGVRFNPDQRQIARTELSFLGHTISATGLKPDPEILKPSEIRIPLQVSQTCRPSLEWFNILVGTFQI